MWLVLSVLWGVGVEARRWDGWAHLGLRDTRGEPPSHVVGDKGWEPGGRAKTSSSDDDNGTFSCRRTDVEEPRRLIANNTIISW